MGFARKKQIVQLSGARLNEQPGHVLWEVNGLQNASPAGVVRSYYSRCRYGTRDAPAIMAIPTR